MAQGNPTGDVSSVRSFYDSYVEEHVPYHRSPRGLKRVLLAALPYWSYREWRFWERNVPRCEALLDLGCARGREVFRAKARRCVGADLAAKALADCAEHYDGAALAELESLPFPDASFDCVVSSHVIGHIPPEKKPLVFAEIARVLRPGGRTAHVIETESSRELVRKAKAHPELYRSRVLDPDGHVGLEPPSRVLERFRQAGFEVSSVEKMEARTLHPRLWVKWFDNEYRAHDAEIDRAVLRAKRTLASPIRLAAEEIRLGIRHRTIEQWAPDVDEAMFVAVVADKPPN